MIHEDIRISSKRIIPSNCKHMDGSPPLHECLQQIILFDLTLSDLILIPGEDCWWKKPLVVALKHSEGIKHTVLFQQQQTYNN